MKPSGGQRGIWPSYHLDSQGWDRRPPWEACRLAPWAEAQTRLPEASGSHISPYPAKAPLDAGCGTHCSSAAEVAGGPRAGARLSLARRAQTTLAPNLMHLALRRRLRLPLPLTRRRCGGDMPPPAHGASGTALVCGQAGLDPGRRVCVATAAL